MRKRISLVLLLIYPLSLFAQHYKNAYIASNGWKITRGDTIMLGKASYEDQKFVSIKQSQSPHLAAKNIFNDNHVIIYDVFWPASGNRKKARAFFMDKDGVRYVITIEKALATKELIPPDNYWNYVKNGHAPPLTFSGKLNVTHANMEQVFKDIMAGFRKCFNDSTGAVTTKDMVKGIFVAQVMYPYQSKISLGNSATRGKVECRMEIRLKDGQWEYLFTDFRHFANPDNKPDIYYFSLLTIDKECPPDKIYVFHGTKWSNNVWRELKYSADTFSAHTVAIMQRALQ